MSKAYYYISRRERVSRGKYLFSYIDKHAKPIDPAEVSPEKCWDKLPLAEKNLKILHNRQLTKIKLFGKLADKGVYSLVEVHFAS